MFSVRLAWLLGTNASQRDKIQDQLGTLYSLRNNIVHEFTPPINSIEFKRNFNDDFKIASDIAKKYLCLSLLRVIKAEKEFLSKEEITSKLSNKLEGKKIDLEFSFHDEIISEKISSLTGRNSSPKNERDIYNELPNKKEIYILGLNTYGGLVEPTHKTIANYPYLYNHDYRIIPDKKTIARLKNKINLVCNQIIKSKYKTIKIVSKSYLPLLFFIGYKFRNQNFIIKMNFQDIEKELITHKNLDADFDSFWISDFKNYNSDSDNLIIIINTSTNLFESFIVSNECNRLKNDYLIIYTLRPENESNDSKKTISSFEYLEKATFSLYKEITNFSGVNNKKIHLFFRGPSCMEILLGRYFSNLKNTIFLYELGKINSDNSYQEFFCFFSLKKGNY